MKKGVIIAILVAIVVSLGLYFAPITPEKKEAVVNPQTASLDQKVDEAVLIIQNAEGAPMRGIAMLREVLSEDPNHVKANYWMGEFSWMSGQFDKAVPRFEKVLEVNPSNADAAKRLVTVYVQLQQNEKAKNVADTFEKNNPNHEAMAEMKAILDNI
jgi:lipopolysaccharide biosynthesis regulator YciM